MDIQRRSCLLLRLLDKRPFVARWALALACFGSTACPQSEEAELAPAPDAPFRSTVYVIRDPGHPLAGAQILFKAKAIATSDAAGVAKVEVSGNEGESVSLAIRCPDGYASPEHPLIVGLRRLAPNSPAPRFDVRCTPLVRTFVVGLRAEHGANLPVLQLGKPVARTDGNGLAHFVLKVKPTEQVALTLDTTEKGSEALRPQNPVLTFVAKDVDDIVLLEQPFKVERKRVSRPPPKPIRM